MALVRSWNFYTGHSVPAISYFTPFTMLGFGFLLMMQDPLSRVVSTC